MHYRPSNIGNIPALYFEMPKTFSNYSLEKKLQQIDAKICNGTFRPRQTTLQMFTDKGLINYYFCMLLLHMKMCKLFKGY